MITFEQFALSAVNGIAIAFLAAWFIAADPRKTWAKVLAWPRRRRRLKAEAISPIVPGLVNGSIWHCNCTDPACEHSVRVLAVVVTKGDKTLVCVEMLADVNAPDMFGLSLGYFLAQFRFEGLGSFEAVKA